MWWRLPAGAQSLPGESQRRALAKLACAQPRGFAHDVVTRHWHHPLALGELQLDHHHGLLAKRHFGGRQIELPHADKTGIVDTLNLLAMSKETCAPVFERLGIVQPQNLDVSDKQPR